MCYFSNGLEGQKEQEKLNALMKVIVVMRVDFYAREKRKKYAEEFFYLKLK